MLDDIMHNDIGLQLGDPQLESQQHLTFLPSTQAWPEIEKHHPNSMFAAVQVEVVYRVLSSLQVAVPAELPWLVELHSTSTVTVKSANSIMSPNVR